MLQTQSRSPHAAMKESMGEQRMRPEGGTAYGHPCRSNSRLGLQAMGTTVEQCLRCGPCVQSHVGVMPGELQPAGKPCEVRSERTAYHEDYKLEP